MVPVVPIAIGAGVLAAAVIGYNRYQNSKGGAPLTLPAPLKARIPIKRPADLGPPAPSEFQKAVEAKGVSLTPGMTPANLVPPPPPPKVPDVYVAPPLVVPPANAQRIPEVTVTGSPMRFTPGAMPNFAATPAAGLADTAAHRTGQRDLVKWLESVRYNGLGDECSYLPVLQERPYTLADVNGKSDARTRAVTWLFQRWANVIYQPGTPLTEDGLFGPVTYAALANVR